MQTIVVSAVNLRKGGTLTILRQCLEYLSARDDVKTIALVHDRKLCNYPGIEYIEIPWAVNSWALRLWCEYVTMYGISRKLARRFGSPVDVWLSLHDTTPNVIAKKQEVYCHTSFPFLKVKAHDWLMDPKIPLFAMLTKWAYRINVQRNISIIVQQEWFADALSGLLKVPREKFRVIPPAHPEPASETLPTPPDRHKFLYVSTPDCHKNFETLCAAAEILEKGGCKFKVVMTVKGDENRYARWLYEKYMNVKSLDFHGLVSKQTLDGLYRSAGTLVFPSRVETWGLPISEYMAANGGGRLLLADEPYAHETSEGAASVTYFRTCDPVDLAVKMKKILNDN